MLLLTQAQLLLALHVNLMHINLLVEFVNPVLQIVCLLDAQLLVELLHALLVCLDTSLVIVLLVQHALLDVLLVLLPLFVLLAALLAILWLLVLVPLVESQDAQLVQQPLTVPHVWQDYSLSQLELHQLLLFNVQNVPIHV